MKFRLTAVLLFLQVVVAYSQEKFLPVVKKGTKLTYQVSASGQVFPVEMKVDSLSPDYVRFQWSMSDGTSGYVTNTKSSLEAATNAYWGNLNNGEDQTMAPDQTVIVASRAVWNAAQKDKKFTFDMQEFIVKDQPADAVFKLGDKQVNALYAESANKSTRLWLLNNPAAPILLKIEGNPMGVDAVLQLVE